jgi:ubiquinone/menaquinone biosynthesis C-methylase UbiE
MLVAAHQCSLMHLIANGYENITVLDLSGAALAAAKTRLGNRASSVQWLEVNVIEVEFPEYGYDVWHDRAVFHFLTTVEERHAYVQAVLRSVKPGGFVIVATFAEDGPTKCSGLPVVRYSANELHAEFGESFHLLGHEKELHHTPSGNEQRFVYCYFRKVG